MITCPAGQERESVVLSAAVPHTVVAEHTTELLPEQVPDWQVSVWVHASPSLHDVPSAALGLSQVPVAESQVPAVWHWSLAVHTTGFAPVHVPDWHVSVWVQASPSLQLVPSLTAGSLQAPVLGSQVPAE